MENVVWIIEIKVNGIFIINVKCKAYIMYLIVIRKTLTTAFHGNGRPISCEGIACELVHNAYLMVSAVAYVGHGAIFVVVVGVANLLHLQTWQLTGIMVYKGYICV